MKEYIDRDAVMQMINKWADGYSYIEVPTECAEDEARKILAADVVEVSAIHDSVYEAMQALNSVYFAKRIGNADYMNLMIAISLILPPKMD